MSTKNFKKLLNLSKDELISKIREEESSMFLAKMKHVTGQLENTASLRNGRKNICRMKMLLSQKQGSTES